MKPDDPRKDESAVAPTRQAVVYRGHFYSLDVLRGLAALGVIFWHWQHFFYNGTMAPDLDKSYQPLYILFRPLYLGGWRAVDLFFCLSGFIFFWLYSERITQRRISVREFFVLRFSRLYPLQFATLIFIAEGQMLMAKSFGYFFVIPHNDAYHFVLQLFFASEWGFQRGLSFNATSWSISIEVMLYVIFFVVCLLRWHRWWHLVIYVCLGQALMYWHLLSWSRGVFSFFMGGLTYRLFLYLWPRGLSRNFIVGLIFLTTLLWIVIPAGFDHKTFYESYEASSYRAGLMIAHKDVLGHCLLIMDPLAFNAILFPATILTLALCEAYRGTLGKRVAFVGNMSYSVYLLQFPLQMVFSYVVLSLSLPRTVFFSPWVLLSFFAVLVPLSWGSYTYFERPLQDYLRAKLLKPSLLVPRALESATVVATKRPSEP